jgi:hypothetical protein
MERRQGKKSLAGIAAKRIRVMRAIDARKFR